MNTKQYIFFVVALVTVTGLAMAVPAFADSNTFAGQFNGFGRGHMRGFGLDRGRGAMMKPAIVGTVSAVNGTTITVTGMQGFGVAAVAATFTVDAANAQVMKNNATSTVSSIAVGDTVAIQGAVNGTAVTATSIRDGQMRGFGKVNHFGQTSSTATPSVSSGNGQPVVAGTVSTMNGSTLTITNKRNVQYTIDASNTKIFQGKNTIALSNINVGDTVIVQGTVNGTSVIASTVIDQTKPASTTTTSSGSVPRPHPGFFGGIGQFFMHLFGF